MQLCFLNKIASWMKHFQYWNGKLEMGNKNPAMTHEEIPYFSCLKSLIPKFLIEMPKFLLNDQSEIHLVLYIFG